ncbi:MAG: lactate/malate family dehydrogenase [Promethearchaeati archaeon]
MVLNHTAPFTKIIKIKVGNYSDINNSDLIVITACKNQEHEQTRLEIAEGNIELFKEIRYNCISNQINEKAEKDHHQMILDNFNCFNFNIITNHSILVCL